MSDAPRISNQRLYAALALCAMLVQLVGEVVGAWCPRLGFAITILATLGFLASDAMLFLRKEPG